jgi:hypothetical protein
MDVYKNKFHLMVLMTVQDETRNNNKGRAKDRLIPSVLCGFLYQFYLLFYLLLNILIAERPLKVNLVTFFVSFWIMERSWLFYRKQKIFPPAWIPKFPRATSFLLSTTLNIHNFQSKIKSTDLISFIGWKILAKLLSEVFYWKPQGFS